MYPEGAGDGTRAFLRCASGDTLATTTMELLAEWEGLGPPWAEEGGGYSDEDYKVVKLSTGPKKKCVLSLV